MSAGRAEENRLTAGCVDVEGPRASTKGGSVVVPDDLDVE